MTHTKKLYLDKSFRKHELNFVVLYGDAVKESSIDFELGLQAKRGWFSCLLAGLLCDPQGKYGTH